MSVKRLGSFVLERLIGRGGMGAVYRARHETTGQIVAIKALLIPIAQERERFEAEISTLKLLRHDNIVKLYGYGQEDGVLYYAMEYVDGPSLSTLLKRGRRFTWEEVAYIGASVCRALKHAHDRGVVHRDIKPANILLLDDGVVKVSDYGIAQYFGASRLTNANQVVGTIEYMAPEQAQAGALTPRADVYSLGALMYALLTGKPPYVASSLPELLQKYKQGLPAPIRATRPETPQVVEAVLFDLLQIQPENRPGDARIVGRRLEGLLRTSRVCPRGNPFLNQRFSLEERASESVSSSRVDLENPSVSDFEIEELEERSPDFPYRAIADEQSASFDFRSPFDKTTEQVQVNDDAFSLKSSDVARVTAPSNATSVVESAQDVSNPALLRETLKEDGKKSRLLDPSFEIGAKSSINADETIASGSVPLVRAQKNANAARRKATAAETFVESSPLRKEFNVESQNKSVVSTSNARATDAKNSSEVQAIPIENFKKSRFTIVDEEELGELPTSETRRASVYAQFRVIGLGVVLALTIMLLVNALRAPSADALYLKIDGVMNHSSTKDFQSSLRRVSKDAKTFLNLYPNDQRSTKLRFFMCELEIDELEQRLERLAQTHGRDETAQPLERAYLDARRVSLEDWDRGEKKLRAFVDFFGTDSTDLEIEDESFESILELDAVKNATSSASQATQSNAWKTWNAEIPPTSTLTKQLVVVAKRRLATMRKEQTKARRADLALLNDRLLTAENLQEENPKRAKQIQNAARVLYGEKVWAQEALDKIEKSSVSDDSETNEKQEER